VRVPGPVSSSVTRVLLLLAAAGCGHTEPFGTDVPDPLGPSSSVIPRQLTFNPGDDRSPAASGPSVTYSRRVPDAPYGAFCLAILPAEGGTLRGAFCPPPPSAVDTLVSTWLEPALSPDGTRLAFVWQRGTRLSVFAAWSHHLVVAPSDNPGAPLLSVLLPPLLLPGDRVPNTGLELTWADSATVRFIGAYEWIVRLQSPTATRVADTLPVPLALLELDVTTGLVRVVPGGDSVLAYAVDQAGAVWVAAGPQLFQLTGTGERVPGAVLPATPIDLAFVGTDVVAAFGTDLLAWGHPLAGSWSLIGLPGPARRIAAAAGRALIAEVERGVSAYGEPANLWLFALP
jgi:hypothetical protein